MSVLTTVQEITPFQWLIVAFVVSFTYFSAAAIYNVYFNPLAKYPGPFLAKISMWPSYYHTLKGNRHIWTWQCHEIYGSTFRHRPDGLMISTPTGHRSIYNHNSNVTKANFYTTWTSRANEVNTWTCVDNAKHSRKRRVLNQVFSESALRSAETFVIQNVNRWCELLGENAEVEWSTPRDMAHWTSNLAFDILGDLCFGKSMEIKEPGENELNVIPDAIASYLQAFHHIANAPFTNLWVWLKPKGLDSLINACLPRGTRIFFKFLETSVAERTRLEEELEKQDSDQRNARKDMFHYFFQAKDSETGLSAYTPDELILEALMLVIAGADTTSTTLSATIFYLTRNPLIYARISKEVRTTFGTVDEIRSGTKLSACQYLRACLDEAMRMSPPIPGDLAREVLPGGMELDGVFVPEGTRIGTSTYSLHHNGSIFPDPFVYRPERWIVDEKSGVSAADVARAESAFSAFSAGPRACVGKNLAYLELTITLARLLYQLDVKSPEGNTLGEGAPDLMWGRRDKQQYQLMDFYMACREGPMAQFKMRQA